MGIAKVERIDAADVVQGGELCVAASPQSSPLAESSTCSAIELSGVALMY